MIWYTDNPFYDFVLAYIGEPIPSTRSGYKNIVGTSDVMTNHESPNVHSFREGLRETLLKYSEFSMPYKGRVLVSLAIGLTEKEYLSRDIDNMVKSLLDALKNVVYYDDRQVDVLHVVKKMSEDNRWHIGIKKLSEGDSLWDYQPLYLESPMGF
jgi:Holliday junction resolvase RusA-like endonuclease